MASPQISAEAERLAVVEIIDAWIAEWLHEGSALVAADRQDVLDGTASHRWYLRFRGEEREFITIWMTFHQRTLHHEAQFMPAPEEQIEAVYAYLLKRNRETYAMAFTLGLEDAIYLEGRVPGSAVSTEELDRIVGATLASCDDLFPTAMSMGYASKYRRAPRP